jgi:hypothetical protein
MLVHVEKPTLISRHEELPVEPFSILEDFEKFITMREMISLPSFREIMRHL